MLCPGYVPPTISDDERPLTLDNIRTIFENDFADSPIKEELNKVIDYLSQDGDLFETGRFIKMLTDDAFSETSVHRAISVFLINLGEIMCSHKIKMIAHIWDNSMQMLIDAKKRLDDNAFELLTMTLESLGKYCYDKTKYKNELDDAACYYYAFLEGEKYAMPSSTRRDQFIDPLARRLCLEFNSSIFTDEFIPRIKIKYAIHKYIFV